MTNTTSLTGELEADVAATPAPTDETTNYYTTLVGEGKKYSGEDANEKLATAYHHSTRRIEELKDDLAAKEANETLLNEVLMELRKPSGIDVEDDASDNTAPVPPVQNTDDIAKIVQGELSKERSETKAKANNAETLKLLAETYGSKSDALEAVKKVVNGSDSMKEMLDKMGMTDPAATLKFVTGMVPAAAPLGSNTPGVDTGPAESVASSAGGLTWSQCCALRKSDKKEYNSPAFKARMTAAEDAAIARGEDFFAT